MPKKGVDWRERIARALMGLPLRGRPRGRRTGTKPGERSIPQAWRDLDNQCVEFALNELNNESLDDEKFVSTAARQARIHERRGDYKIRKLGGKFDRAAATSNARTASEAAGKSSDGGERRASLEL